MAYALADAEKIIATLREPFLVLDSKLRVRSANAAYCRLFQVAREEVVDRPFHELNHGQWSGPPLLQMLVNVLHHGVSDQELFIECHLPILGKRSVKLFARRMDSLADNTGEVLLSFDVKSALPQANETGLPDEVAWRKSEVQYRRLFESARDGILILEERTGKIIDANPYMSELLGYTYAHFIGKELWEIGLFKDIEANRAAFRQLQSDGYIRYDHLALETRDKRRVDVEFVSNSYEADGRIVIQCNIRDCSDRFRLEEQVRASLELKEILLREVHHRVKNNLQVISSLLHLQSQHTHDPASVMMLKESQNRVRSMALVHERLYRSNDLTHVDFTDYIESLASHLFACHQVDVELVKLVFDVQGVKLSIDTAIPCGLLLNELISNSLKHAFVNGASGEIRISLIPANEHEVRLSVSDNGVGLPEKIEPNTGETFGMQLIADLVEQLHGSVTVTRDTGTSIRVLFPSNGHAPSPNTDPT